MKTIDEAIRDADEKHRLAYQRVYENPLDCAREIAEHVSEPELLIEKVIVELKKKHRDGPSVNLANVTALIDSVIRDFANHEAEAAYNFATHQPL